MRIGDVDYPLDGNGFLLDPQSWNQSVAEAIAHEEGIDQMTEQHWAVVKFIRSHWETTDLAPAVRLLCKETSTSVRDMYKLFRSGPAKGACRIAGLPKPDGCV